MQEPEGAVPAELARGRVVYLLTLVAVVQFIYPMTVSGTTLALLIYQALYASLLLVGILVVREQRWQALLLTVLGIAWLVTAAVYTFNQDAIWALVLGYVVLVAFQMMVVLVLLRFIFRAGWVTRDILYAAVAVYLLLGAIFVPLYGLIETSTFVSSGAHAFVDAVAGTGTVLPWQSLVYFSYATLTTLGYGDILPVTPSARSAVSLEAVIGVLYVTIIMARLVGLYASSGSGRR